VIDQTAKFGFKNFGTVGVIHHLCKQTQ